AITSAWARRAGGGKRGGLTPPPPPPPPTPPPPPPPPGRPRPLRRTALPFVLTGVFVSITGAAMAGYAPGAHSIGQVMQHRSNSR
ncbi:MAG: hypothetical protein K0M66_12070, partial [Thiobacillus sp.]|nr:hypothetical protein [Thiobacillus sp.]